MTADPPDLPDQEARDAIARDLEATLFAEASAGSGKTTALVARLVAILVGGRARVDQVAAITFTESAAGELRDRVAQRLEEVASSSAGTAAAAAAEEALDGLDAAAITTLHGFARRVLAEHPFAAGLPPKFEVLDEIQSSVDFADRWTGMVDRLLDDPDDGRALEWGLVSGVTLDALRSIARDLEAGWDRVPVSAGPMSPPPISSGEVLEPLRAALDLVDACSDPGDLLLSRLKQLEPWVERLAACRDEVELLTLLVQLGGKVAARHGRAASWAGRKAEVRELLGQAEAAREHTVTAAAVFALRRLGVALGTAARDAAAARRREGRLHFHDLLVIARDLVRDDPGAQAAIHDQYRYILVDEFQDTDPLQADLATRIASTVAPGEACRWQDLDVGGGRLFFVGDPKQAIYRFRGADDRLFHEAKALLAEEELALTTNFRSVPGIVAWVDAVLPELVPPGGPAHVASSAARPPHDDGPRPPVVVLGSAGAPPDTIGEARAAEAADVASVVLSARADRWPVGDESRPADLADIAVLVRTRAVVPALEEAFDRAGIPYRLESSSLVFQAAEVRDLLSVLHAVDDPTDQVSVVAALRSPAFGCGDDDLLRHRQAGGSWDYRVGDRVEGPVGDGLGALRELHGGRPWSEVSELVARVVEERRLLPLCIDGPRWREAWRRLRWVLDQARQFTETSSGDLRQFLRWVDVQRDEEARVTEIVLPESDVDAVRVMTVHAAKGLEFPVVVVVGFGSQPRRGGAGVLFGPDGPELAARQGLATPGHAELAGNEQALDDAERVRLLYVAATRAQDHLVVSVHHPQQGARTLAARVAEACRGCTELWRAPDVPLPPAAPSWTAPTSGAGTTRAAGDDDEQRRAAWAAERDRRLGPGAEPRTVAATAVARLLGAEGDGGPVAPEVLDAGDDGAGRPSWRRGRAGTAVGRAVHAVLQIVDLSDGAGLGELSAAQALAEGVPSRAGDVEALARSALDAEVVRSAVATGRYWRELYIGTPVGDRVLEGIVDLLIDGGDGLEVVDYKTDQGADLDLAVARYRPQGAAYALAVERVLGRPVDRCTFLFLRPGGAVPRAVEDLDAAKRAVAAAVGATGASGST